MGNSTLRKLNDNYEVASHCLANQRSLKNLVTTEVMQMQLATSKINLTGTTGSMPLVWISLSVFGASSMLIDFIVYHRLLGVGKNIIYDESKDKELLLKPFIHAKIVLYFPADFKSQIKCQVTAFKLAREQNVNFLGSFDVDEFVVLQDLDELWDIK